MKTFIIPVRIGYGKTGNAKCGIRNVQATTEDAMSDLHEAAKIISRKPPCEADYVMIVRQLLDMMPSDVHVHDMMVAQAGVRIILYLDGMSSLPRDAAEQLSRRPFNEPCRGEEPVSI